MKLFAKLLKKGKKRKNLLDQTQELLNKRGAEQFQKLVDRGLRIPVVVL